MSESSTGQLEAVDAGQASSFRVLLTHRRRATGYREPLRLGSPGAAPGPGDSSSLTMLWIPPGRFWMGSAANEPERSDPEGPQHRVQLEGFFLAQTPISQAQWREVAGWETVTRALDPEPSLFMASPQGQPARKAARGKTSGNDGSFVARLLKGEAAFRLLEGEASTDQRPVEQVSWPDAMEFCARLSQRTGRLYTLPSEAQWEYACRAGTTTPFHFGATISGDLANVNATVPYANGPMGDHRKQTTPVGLFPANAWGLHDMHGNVWEWCLDHWHDSYAGAPEDGRPWLEEKAAEEAPRLLRGGSWFALPQNCRSAHRGEVRPGGRSYDGGFRVCCLPHPWPPAP
jgi:formylglycine-generating enzyme required for sulfatase activity